MRISDWSSDVCSSDLPRACLSLALAPRALQRRAGLCPAARRGRYPRCRECRRLCGDRRRSVGPAGLARRAMVGVAPCARRGAPGHRSEEHTSELQSLMRISYAVFCLTKTTRLKTTYTTALSQPPNV